MGDRPADRGFGGDVPVSHTAQMLLGGLVLLAAVYGIAHLRRWPMRRAFAVFAALWALVAAVNLWVGVAHAGYALAEELPIFGLVFAVPTALAWLALRGRE